MIYTTKKGKSVDSSLNSRQAIQTLRDHCQASNFAQSLLSAHGGRRGLTDDQWSWVHILANEALARAVKPGQPQVKVGDMTGILKLFETVKQHLTFPKIRLWLKDGTCIKLWPAGERAKVPGSISMIDNDSKQWVGRIHQDGRLEARNASPELVELLGAFAADPAKVAAEMGRAHGACCFCTADLCDERSLAVGYGPVCAERYSLPYPTKSEARLAPANNLFTVNSDVAPQQAENTGTFLDIAAGI